MNAAQKSVAMTEIMDAIETDGGPRQWVFDTSGNVTFSPAGLADLIAWASKSKRAGETVGKIMQVADGTEASA